MVVTTTKTTRKIINFFLNYTTPRIMKIYTHNLWKNKKAIFFRRKRQGKKANIFYYHTVKKEFRFSIFLISKTDIYRKIFFKYLFWKKRDVCQKMIYRITEKWHFLNYIIYMKQNKKVSDLVTHSKDWLQNQHYGTRIKT